MRGKSVYKDRLILSLLPIALSKLQLTQWKTEVRSRLTLLFPKVECFFYAIIFLPNQLVRSNPADLEQEMRTFRISLSSFNSSNLFFLPPFRVLRIDQLNSTISNENYPLGGRWSVREALNLCWLLSALFLLRVYPCPERCLFLNLQPVRSGKPKGPYSIMR